MTSPIACANTNLPPRATTGTLRAPSLRSSSIPAGLPCTLIDSYSTPLLVRNSLVLKQLVHPGCQKTLTFSAASMQEPSNRTRGIDLRPAVNNRITRVFRQIHGQQRRRANDPTMASRPGDACSHRRRGTGHGSSQQLPERQGAAPARGRRKGHLRETRPRPAALLYRELDEAARWARRRRVRHRAFGGGQRRGPGRAGEEGRGHRHRRRQRNERVLRPGRRPFLRRSARTQARGRRTGHGVRDPGEEDPAEARPQGRHGLRGGAGGTGRAAPESHGREQGLRRCDTESPVYHPSRATGHEKPGKYRRHPRALSSERSLCAARLGRLSRPAARALHRRLCRVAALGAATREPRGVRGDSHGQVESFARGRGANLQPARRSGPRVHAGRAVRHGRLPQPPCAARRDRGRGNPGARRKIPRPFALPAGDRHAGQSVTRVAQSAPDGHTMLLVQSGFVSNPILMRNLPYDQARDLAPVSSLASGPMVLVVHPSLPAKSVRELIAFAKSRPGELNFGSPGAGSLSDLCAQLFDAMAGVKMTHVPYKGSGGALADVLAGRVPVYYMNLVLALPYLKDERLRALGVTTRGRSAVTPELPTIDEAGLPG